jgi:hypothetical protein
MKLSTNFDTSEFFTDTSGTPTASQIENARVLCVDVLQPARDKCGFAVKINSGMRSAAHNIEIGGAKNSEHLYLGDSAAADVDAGNDADNRLLFAALLERKDKIGQLIVYITKAGVVEWIHVSKKSRAKSVPQVMCATAERPTQYAPYTGKIVRP